MGKYIYSDKEKEINKVLKLNQILSKEIQQDMKEIRHSADYQIRESEELLSILGYDLKRKERVDNEIVHTSTNIQKFTKSWEQLVEEATERFPNADIELESILTTEEFQKAYHDLDRIQKEFSKLVKLSSFDIVFLFIAVALQTIKAVLIPEIGGCIDKTTRIDSDDKLIKNEVKRENKAYKEKHLKKWKIEKGSQKTWMDMVFKSVPYDATRGAGKLGVKMEGGYHRHNYLSYKFFGKLGVKMEGGYHRYKTLGHDPILGWIFGTADIMTDLITLNSFVSYRVKNMCFTDEIVLLPQLFQEVFDVIQYDWHCLPAAIFAQGVHLKSDKYTKLGLPVPFLGAFSEELAGKLYHSQYDELCLIRDSKIVSASAMISIFINMGIGLFHGLFYSSQKDGSREVYEVRTRKILLYSNVIATSSNIIMATLVQNPRKLDIGGLLVTLGRLFSDVRFIIKLKDEFIQSNLDAGLLRELNEIEQLYK